MVFPINESCKRILFFSSTVFPCIFLISLFFLQTFWNITLTIIIVISKTHPTKNKKPQVGIWKNKSRKQQTSCKITTKTLKYIPTTNIDRFKSSNSTAIASIIRRSNTFRTGSTSWGASLKNAANASCLVSLPNVFTLSCKHWCIVLVKNIDLM